MLTLLLGFLIHCTSLHTHAETLLGHNLTPTSYTLNRGQVMAGNYAVAYGIDDHLTVGTSPWLIMQYNMPALSARYGFETSGYIQRVAIEQLYFKTFHYGLDLYQQESTWTRVTATHRYNHWYSLHGDLGVQYFINDQVPFSMRPIPTNQTPLTISTSTLQEFNITENLGAFWETGILGLNYPNRYLHVGLSGFYRWAGGFVQLGLSKSFPIGSEMIALDQFDIWENSQGVYRASVYRKLPAPIHPEVQFQITL